jgi:predicted nucleic acid-binding protein
LSSSSTFRQSIRRLKPEKRRAGLAYRDRSVLPFLANWQPPFPNFLLDTTVYVDALQNRLPEEADVALRASIVWHSSVTEAELAAAVGQLDPTDPRSTNHIERIIESIDRRAPHRILSPDREIWREAGILAGMLARLQNYDKDDRRKALNDALIFLTAAKYGCAVLTRNVKEFDLLLQLNGRGQVIFYDQSP